MLTHDNCNGKRIDEVCRKVGIDSSHHHQHHVGVLCDSFWSPLGSEPSAQIIRPIQRPAVQQSPSTPATRDRCVQVVKAVDRSARTHFGFHLSIRLSTLFKLLCIDASLLCIAFGSETVEGAGELHWEWQHTLVLYGLVDFNQTSILAKSASCALCPDIEPRIRYLGVSLDSYLRPHPD